MDTVKPTLETFTTDDLHVAVETYGPKDGNTVVLMHGFPDDVRAYDGVVPDLVADGFRVLVPYLRGYGPTRFRDPDAPRMAQQAAIGEDLYQLLDATGTEQALLAGYDWGGRAACITAIMHPERVKGLVSITGYNVKIGRLPQPPSDPKQLQALWYQWLFGTKPGRIALETNRDALCEAMWRWWSPTWSYTPEQFARTAESFQNPDFVDVVIHSYSHRWAGADGDPRFEAIEAHLATKPPITVPSVILHGIDDGVAPVAGSRDHVALFPPGTPRIEVENAGHFLPWERPDSVVEALRTLA